MILAREKIIQSLLEIRPVLEQQGIRILGIFGSYARNEANENSDVDVLIETTEKFVQNTDPLKAFTILYEIKEKLGHQLNKSVDIADKSGMNEIGKEFILDEVIYV